jgi:hypothetical protein
MKIDLNETPKNQNKTTPLQSSAMQQQYDSRNVGAGGQSITAKQVSQKGSNLL